MDKYFYFRLNEVIFGWRKQKRKKKKKKIVVLKAYFGILQKENIFIFLKHHQNYSFFFSVLFKKQFS